MTDPSQFELVELATPYALHAISDAERADVEQRVAAAPTAVAQAFRDEVRAVLVALLVEPGLRWRPQFHVKPR